MEATTHINLEEETCDIEIRNLPLTRISNLSMIQKSVAMDLEFALTLLGMTPEEAERYVNLLLSGKTSIQGILKAVPSHLQNPHDDNGHHYR